MKVRPEAKHLREALFEPLKGLPGQRRVQRQIYKATRWVVNKFFDRNMETAKSTVELDHFHRDRVWYVPSDWLDLRRALRGIEIGPRDVFVDFGSGKGRMVYQAARYPFGRVIGVEISEKLNQVARENIERKRHKLKCRRIDLVTSDALEYEIPDEMSVAYFYHPFGGETFMAVLDNILRSIDRSPRSVTLIYQIPLMEDHLLSTERFKLVRTAKHKATSPYRIAVYESLSPLA